MIAGGEKEPDFKAIKIEFFRYKLKTSWKQESSNFIFLTKVNSFEIALFEENLKQKSNLKLIFKALDKIWVNYHRNGWI